MKCLDELSREELLGLLQDAAKNWLAHDGLWFQAVERSYGLEAAMRLDGQSWEQFTVIEARRIMARLGLKPGGGIPALVRALGLRLYAHLNQQEITQISEKRCLLKLRSCRVQAARQRRGLPDFPCKQVGLIEYSGFARTIDPRIQTSCLLCPPDLHPRELWCAWEFSLSGQGGAAE